MGITQGMPQEVGGTPTASPLGRRRCVLWLARGPAPPPLLTRLTGRGVAVTPVDRADQVMVELARRDVGVVIVCLPQSREGAAELVEAVQRYYPRVALWQYEQARADGQPTLRRMVHPGSGPLQGAAVGGEDGRTGRLDQRENRPVRRAAGLPTTPLLTREELDMLLGTPFEDSGPVAADWSDDGL